MMLDLVEALALKKTRLQRLQTEMEQLRGEIDILSKAVVILERQSAENPQTAAVIAAPGNNGAAAPQPKAASGEIRKQFP